MRISQGVVASEERGPTFSGQVWADPVLGAQDGVVVNNVFFEPGSRTHWHRHEVGQVFHVTVGHGWVQTRAGHGEPLACGDTVHIPAGEEHWHGARPDACMSHLAISIGETQWLDPVSEADYAGAFAVR
jgi:quercetin dioxygenase-like cupin family protein